MEQLEKFGIKTRVTGFVLPLGYSFNLDGSMMYTTFWRCSSPDLRHPDDPHRPDHHAAGADGVVRHCRRAARLAGGGGGRRAADVYAEADLLLILGIDHFTDMGRTVTNVLGNAIHPTAVVAK